MKYAYSRTIGTSRIMGTDHPIEVVVYKAGRTWIVATLYCKIAKYVKEFPTRRAAIADAEER